MSILNEIKNVWVLSNFHKLLIMLQLIIQKEHIEENFMLGISALIAGDFVFLPSDTRICKAMQPTGSEDDTLGTMTLFMRVRFFLPSLRGIRSPQARHLLYLQLRRSILEHQLPLSFSQLIEMNGFAMQAEFGDYRDKVSSQFDFMIFILFQDFESIKKSNFSNIFCCLHWEMKTLCCLNYFIEFAFCTRTNV